MVFISLVMVKFHERIMITYIIFSLSTIFMIGFVGFSSKPSPVYGGLGLTAVGVLVVVLYWIFVSLFHN